MTNSKIIHLLKDDTAKVMKRLGKDNIDPTFMSKAIAYVLYLYSEKKIDESDLKDRNNPIGYINPSNGEKEFFDSIMTCMLRYATESVEDKQFELAYEGIVKANNLYRFDKEYLNTIDGSIIDLDDEQARPNVDVYTVKESDDTVVTNTSDIAEANDIKNSKIGRTVTDSRGRIVGGTVTPYKSAALVSIALKPGAKVECSGLNLYYKATDRSPGRCISGTYYLYDGKEINGRYALCLKPEFVGNAHTIIGYVESKQLKK